MALPAAWFHSELPDPDVNIPHYNLFLIMVIIILMDKLSANFKLTTY